MELTEELFPCELPAPNYHQLKSNNALVRYDAAKLVKGSEDALVLSIDKHTGPVAALDFNPFQVGSSNKLPELCSIIFFTATDQSIFRQTSWLVEQASLKFTFGM